MAEWKFESREGGTLAGLRWDAPEPRGLVYLAHGLAEHVERYDAFARALNGIGLSVAGHDHRGHKLSVASDADLGHFADRDGFPLMARDLSAGMSAWRAAHPGLPLILFGHSMGSFLAQYLMGRDPAGIDFLIMSGSNGPQPRALAVAARLIARVERLRLGGRGQSRLIHGLVFDANNKPFEPGPTSMEWLSRDRAAVDAYVADPCCGYIATTASWTSLLDELSRLATPAQMRGVPTGVPTLILSGDRDPVGGMGKGVQRLHDIWKAHGVADLTMKLYPGGRHEMLNETNRDEVIADICGWIGERLPPS